MFPKEMLSTLLFILRHPLNRGNRFAALKRWVSWQIGSRLVPGAVAVRFVNDVYFLAEPGMTGVTGNIYSGLHEFESMSFVLHYLRPGDLFVDVGANVGSYTLLAAGGGGASCIAIEPIAATFQQLQKNIVLNALADKVRLLNVAVGRESGRVLFTSGFDTENHALGADEAAGADVREVDVVTLDMVLCDDRPSLIKIDVEGFESNVLDGAKQIFAAGSPAALLIELNGLGARYRFDEAAIHRRLVSYGLHPFHYSPLDRVLRPAGGPNPHGNTLYLRDAERSAERLASAPLFSVLDRRV